MADKLNSKKESNSNNNILALKFWANLSKTKLLVWSILLALALIFYYVYWLNMVSVTNRTDYDLQNVTISKRYGRSPNPALWSGQIPANSKKYLYVSAGGSDNSIILKASWQGKDIVKEQEYPAIGPGKFRFIIHQNGKMVIPPFLVGA